MPDLEPQLTASREKRIKPIGGPGIFWLLIILVLVLLVFAVSLLGKSQNPGSLESSVSYTPTPTAESKQLRLYTVSYKNGVFSPTNLRIHAGDTVRFKNDGILPIRIVSDDLVGLDSVGNVPQGSYFSFTFAAKGIFEYHNDKDPQQNGTVIVR